MTLVMWDETYVLGVEDIDRQHKELLRLLNEMCKCMHDGTSHDALRGIMSEFVLVSKNNFDMEEEIMTRYEYPGLGEHRDEHEEHLRGIARFGRGIDIGSIPSCISLLSFLRDFLTTHIKETDKLCCEFMKEKGLVREISQINR